MATTTTFKRTKPPRRRKVRRAGALAPPPAAITLAIAPPHRFGWKDLAIFAAGVSAIALGLSAAYFAPRVLPRSEEVTLITVEEPPPPPPPPPPEELKPPPPPPPPPPDPDQPPPPPQPENAPPPPPQFGLPDEGTSENGSFAVARGNTLMKRPDSVVKPPPPPLPPAPIQLERAPAFLKAVPPEYPEWALEDGVEAAVQLMVTVNEQGRVTEATVLKSGGKDFDQAALRAVRASLFEPLVRGGKTLPSRFVQPYNFTLE